MSQGPPPLPPRDSAPPAASNAAASAARGRAVPPRASSLKSKSGKLALQYVLNDESAAGPVSSSRAAVASGSSALRRLVQSGQGRSNFGGLGMGSGAGSEPSSSHGIDPATSSSRRPRPQPSAPTPPPPVPAPVYPTHQRRDRDDGSASRQYGPPLMPAPPQHRDGHSGPAHPSSGHSMHLPNPSPAASSSLGANSTAGQSSARPGIPQRSFSCSECDRTFKERGNVSMHL